MQSATRADADVGVGPAFRIHTGSDLSRVELPIEGLVVGSAVVVGYVVAWALVADEPRGPDAPPVGEVQDAAVPAPVDAVVAGLNTLPFRAAPRCALLADVKFANTPRSPASLPAFR